MAYSEEMKTIAYSDPGELAHALEGLRPAERVDLWATIPVEGRSVALPFSHDKIKSELIEKASVEELQDLT